MRKNKNSHQNSHQNRKTPTEKPKTPTEIGKKGKTPTKTPTNSHPTNFSFAGCFLCRTFALPNDWGKWSSVGPKACLTSPVAREGPSCETEGIPERLRKMFTKCFKENEVKKEVKKEVKPASGLEVMRKRRMIPQEPQTIVHEQSSFTPTSVSELTPTLTPHLTPHFSFNTELCVDLKTILTSDRRAKMRKDYTGVLTRDGRDHFTFIEETQERKTCRRHPMVYKGYCINVTRRPDGSLLPHFRLPQYSKYYTFKDCCREAAEELLMMAGLGEEE